MVRYKAGSGGPRKKPRSRKLRRKGSPAEGDLSRDNGSPGNTGRDGRIKDTASQRGRELGGWGAEGRLAKCVSYRLPFPLSVNTLFFNAKRGRVKTTKYQAWLREVSSVIKSQGLVYIPGPVSVEILIIKPDRRRRDLDNMAKSVLDALVLNGVIDDDSLIEKILLAWHSDNLGGCFVEIKSVGDNREGGV